MRVDREVGQFYKLKRASRDELVDAPLAEHPTETRTSWSISSGKRAGHAFALSYGEFAIDTAGTIAWWSLKPHYGQGPPRAHEEGKIEAL